jgi:hypothetical protein
MASLLPLQFKEVYLDRWPRASASTRKLLAAVAGRLQMLYETVEWYGEAPGGGSSRTVRGPQLRGRRHSA